MNRPFESDTRGDVALEEVIIGIDGLINIFKTKIDSLPSTYPVQAYVILVNHLLLHYNNNNTGLFPNSAQIKQKVQICSN